MRSLLVVSLSAVALAAVPAAASAACAPQTQTVSDATGDAFYMQGPDITSLTVSIDATCTLTVSDGLSNRPSLLPEDILQWGLDVDNNPATGRTSSGLFNGDEFGIVLQGGSLQATLYDAPGHAVGPVTAGPFGASVPISMLGATETSTIRVTANGITRTTGGANYGDAVTDPLVFQIQPAPAAPAAPVAPTPLPPASVPAVSCTVPRLTGKTLAAARTSLTAAHCALGAVHRHKAKGRAGVVLESSPKAGTTAASGAKVAVTVRARKG